MNNSSATFFWVSTFDVSLELSQYLHCAGGKNLEESVDPVTLRSKSRIPHIFLYDTPDVLLYPETLSSRCISNSEVRDLRRIYKSACSERYRSFKHIRASRLINISPELVAQELNDHFHGQSAFDRAVFNPGTMCPLRATATHLAIMKSPDSLAWICRYEQFLNGLGKHDAIENNYLDRLGNLSTHDLVYTWLCDYEIKSSKIRMRRQDAEYTDRGSDISSIAQIRVFQQLLVRLQDDIESRDEREVKLCRQISADQKKLKWNREQLAIQKSLSQYYAGISRKMMRILRAQLQMEGLLKYQD